MSAGGSSFIRLRLSFDYPPPAAVGCRLCWLLVDLDSCRVVADLESLIRDKFEFSRGSVLSLFVQDCYLPHTESALLVRDNDSVRVKVDSVSQVNGLSSRPAPDAVQHRKRKSVVEEEEDDGGAARKKKKKEEKNKKKEEEEEKKKRGKRREEDGGQDAAAPAGRGCNKESPAKSPKKKKKKKKKTCPPASPRPPQAGVLQSPRPQRSKLAGRPPPPSSSSSSSSDDASTRTKPPPPTAPPAPPRTSEPVQSSDSSHKRAAAGPPPSSQTPHGEEEEEEEEEEEIQLVIHPPKQHPWRGGGRGGGRGGRFESRAKLPSSEPETPTPTPGVLQNGALKRDYTLMPLLAAPPPVGQKIAFKLLELTENYTPEVSEYKEGKILSFDPTTKQVEVELLVASPGPAEPGKFDLVYQNPDGSERVEYALCRGSRVTEQWETLLEPRLILQ